MIAKILVLLLVVLVALAAQTASAVPVNPVDELLQVLVPHERRGWSDDDAAAWDGDAPHAHAGLHTRSGWTDRASTSSWKNDADVDEHVGRAVDEAAMLAIRSRMRTSDSTPEPETETEAEASGESSPGAIVAVELLPLLREYLGQLDDIGDEAMEAARKTADDWFQQVKETKKPWEFSRILARNLNTALPRVWSWVGEGKQALISLLEQLVSPDRGSYYLTVESPVLSHLKIEPLSVTQVTQTMKGIDFKLNLELAGGFDVALTRYKPAPRKRLTSMTVTFTEPITVQLDAKVRLGATPADTEVELSLDVGTDALLGLQVSGKVNIEHPAMSAVEEKAGKIAEKIRHLAVGFNAWARRTTNPHYREVFGGLGDAVDAVVDEMESLVNTGQVMTKHVLNRLTTRTHLHATVNALLESNLPMIKEILKTVINGNKPMTDFLKAPTESDVALKFEVKKLFFNKQALTSDLGTHVLNTVLEPFLINVDDLATAKADYEQREKDHGGPLVTVQACAKAMCQRDGGANCNDADVLLNYKALTSVAYKNPPHAQLAAGQKRRTCIAGNIIPTLLAGSSDPTEPYCCVVESQMSGGRGTANVLGATRGPCTVQRCTGQSPPRTVNDVQITYGDTNRKQIPHDVFAPVFFRGTTNPRIDRKRWFADDTLMFKRTTVLTTKDSITDIKFIWQGKDTCPSGYKLLRGSYLNTKSANLNQGKGTRKSGFKEGYLCIRFGPLSAESIVDLELLWSGQQPSPGFVRIDRSASGRYSANFNYGRWRDDSHAVHLAVKRVGTAFPTLHKGAAAKAAERAHWADAENAAMLLQLGEYYAADEDDEDADEETLDGAQAALATAARWGRRRRRTQPSPAPRRQPVPEPRRQPETPAVNVGITDPDDEPFRDGSLTDWGIGITVGPAKMWIHHWLPKAFILHDLDFEYTDDISSMIAGTPAVPGIKLSFDVAMRIRAQLAVEGQGGVGFGASVLNLFTRQSRVDRFDCSEFPGLRPGRIIGNTAGVARANMRVAADAAFFFNDGKWSMQTGKVEIKQVDMQIPMDRGFKRWIVETATDITEKTGILNRALEGIKLAFDTTAEELVEYGPEFKALAGVGAVMEAKVAVSVPTSFFRSELLAPAWEMARQTVLDLGYQVTQ